MRKMRVRVLKRNNKVLEVLATMMRMRCLRWL